MAVSGKLTSGMFTLRAVDAEDEPASCKTEMMFEKKLSMVNGVVTTAQCCTSFETHVWQWVCKLAFVEVTSASCRSHDSV